MGRLTPAGLVLTLVAIGAACGSGGSTAGNGGAGTISATANVNPAAIDALYQSASSQARNPRHQGKPDADVEQSGIENRESGIENRQLQLNVVREIFSSREFPSIIAAIKQAIAIYADDPEWARVRPPLVELTSEQARSLAVQLQAIGFTFGDH